MERLDRNIGALQAAFQETPEVLHSIGVNLAVNVGFGVINDLVGVFIQPVIGKKLIGVDGRSRFNVLTQVSLKRLLACDDSELQ
jgi:hypothetical protein